RSRPARHLRPDPAPARPADRAEGRAGLGREGARTRLGRAAGAVLHLGAVFAAASPGVAAGPPSGSGAHGRRPRRADDRLELRDGAVGRPVRPRLRRARRGARALLLDPVQLRSDRLGGCPCAGAGSAASAALMRRAAVAIVVAMMLTAAGGSDRATLRPF